MKILLANFTKMVNDSGGLAKVTSAFANEMVARGHDVSILYRYKVKFRTVEKSSLEEAMRF